MNNNEAVAVMRTAVKSMWKDYSISGHLCATEISIMRILNDAIEAEEWEPDNYVQTYNNAITMAQRILVP
jgi:hypothetical protein